MVLLCYLLAGSLLRPSGVMEAGDLWGHTPGAAIPWYGVSGFIAAGAFLYLAWWIFRLAGPSAKVYTHPLYRPDPEDLGEGEAHKTIPTRGEWIAAGILLVFLFASAAWLPLAAWVRAKPTWDVASFGNVTALWGPLLVAAVAAVAQMIWVTHPGKSVGLSKNERTHRHVAFGASIYLAFHTLVLDGLLFPAWWFRVL